MWLGATLLTYTVPGDVLVDRLHMGVIIHNEPEATPLHRLCVRVHFIIYNEPGDTPLIQSPKQPTPTYKKHTEAVHRLPIAFGSAVGSLRNASVCFL